MVPEKSCCPGSSECHCSFRLLASLISKVHSCCIYPPENQYTVPLTNMLSAEEIGHSFQKYQVAFCFLLQFLSYQENPDPSALFSPKTTQYMTVFRDVRGVQSDQCLRGASSLLSSCWPSCRYAIFILRVFDHLGYLFLFIFFFICPWCLCVCCVWIVLFFLYIRESEFLRDVCLSLFSKDIYILQDGLEKAKRERGKGIRASSWQVSVSGVEVKSPKEVVK